MQIAIFPTDHTAASIEAVRAAESAGFHSLWQAESYGADVFTSLAWWAAHTGRVALGSVVAVIDARAPTMTAATAMALDSLSGGRFILGLGVSGPAVVEGWFGRPFGRPLARTREYVDIVRQVIRRESPVRYRGEFYQLPYEGPGAAGLGRPLKPLHHPTRFDQPIFLAAEGPKNVELAAEIADGWTAFYITPTSDSFYRTRLEAGFSRRGRRPFGFEVLGQIHVAIDDDVERAADLVRSNIALMVGGMGAPGSNFHYDAVARIGFESEAARVHRLWSLGDRKGAAASIPLRMVESLSLVGPLDKIRSDFDDWRDTCVTIVLPVVSGRPLDADLVRALAAIILDQ